MVDILHDVHDYDGHSRIVRLSESASLNGVEQLTARLSGSLVTLTRMGSEKKPKSFVFSATELVDLYEALQVYHQACDAYTEMRRQEMRDMLNTAMADAEVLGGMITDVTEEQGYHTGEMYYSGKLTFTGRWFHCSMDAGTSIYAIARRLENVKHDMGIVSPTAQGEDDGRDN